jgi:DNA-binding NarL/FixJ family response regulator
MRVLIADRNVRLLESISLTFGHQFSIHTASTRRRCGDHLRQGEFDLAIVSEKLADGPGLQLLGQIARSCPDTLRIFVARRSRLQLLKGRLGPLGLFRTLPYPIDAQKLLSALTLARTGLEIDLPSASASTPKPGPAAVRPNVKLISPASADPALGIKMPATITSVTRVRPSELSRAPQAPSVARQASGVSPGVRSVHALAPRSSAPQHRATKSRARSVERQTLNDASHLRNFAPHRPQPQRPEEQSALPQPAVARSAAPPRLPSQSEAFQRALARREAAKGTANSQIVSRSSRRGRQLVEAGRGRTHSLAQTPPLGSLSELVRVATVARPTRKPQLADTAPKRTMVLLGVTMVVVFLVTTLTLNLFFAAAAPSSSAQATRTSVPRLEVEQSDTSKPRENSIPLVRPMRSVARLAEPPPASTRADVVAQNPQMAASNTPIADPSTFGSEAYEPIYSN